FRKALSFGQSIGSKFEQCDSYLGIGSVYYVKGQMNDAANALLRSIELSNEIQFIGFWWDGLYKRGLVSRAIGKNKEALQFLQRAVEVIEEQRYEFGLAEEKTSYLVQKLDVYDDLIHLLIATKKISEAFNYVQRAKARSFLDTLAEARIDPEGSIDPGMKQEKKKVFSELVKTETEIRNEYENEKIDRKKIDELKTKRNELDTAYNNLLFKIRKQNPRFANLQYPQPLKLSEAQDLIDEQSVLLEYFLGKKSSFVFAVTPTQVQVFELPAEQRLSAQISLIHDVLQKPQPGSELSEKAHSTYAGVSSVLYEELIAPVKNEITGKRRIIIAPDGILNYLPFECLLTRRTKSGTIDFSRLPYLTRDYDIQYVPSGSVLRALEANIHEDQKEQNDLIAFADPVYAAERFWNRGKQKSVLPALPNSRLEVERITLLFPQNKTTAFLEKMPVKQILNTLI
ncbi:CHAT domain-containing protein, partial [bacterium]|nr:CHAT domain-containing protein [bacterium]